MESNGSQPIIHQSPFRLFVKEIYGVHLHVIPRELFDLINSALGKLGENERTALILRYGLYDNQFKSTDEVGAMCDPQVAGPAIYQRLKKAKQQIRLHCYSSAVRTHLHALRNGEIS